MGENEHRAPDYVYEILEQDPDALKNMEAYMKEANAKVSDAEDEFIDKVVDIFMEACEKYFKDHNIEIKDIEGIRKSVGAVAIANRAMLDHEVKCRFLGTTGVFKM